MNKQVTGKEILSFLEEMKELISEGRYKLIHRHKNLQSLTEHGLSIRDVKETLLDLKAGDYYGGPKSDYDFSEGDIWEFIKKLKTYCFISS